MELESHASDDSESGRTPPSPRSVSLTRTSVPAGKLLPTSEPPPVVETDRPLRRVDAGDNPPENDGNSRHGLSQTSSAPGNQNSALDSDSHSESESTVLRRRDGSPFDAESSEFPNAVSESSRSKSSGTAKTNHRPDPVLQSLTLLLTMGLMLAAARYAVPGIVEEVRYAWHRGELRAEYETGSEGLKNVSLDTLSQAYQMVTAAVGPSVVHIEVERRPIDLSGQVVGKLARPSMQTADQGSGVIVDAEGYILTNDHVIAEGEIITVTLSDGRRVDATVVGVDALTDLALLKVNADRLIPIAWGDSDRCKVGSPVWAVGSPFGLDRTVTFGILSGKHRMVFAKSSHYQDFMQSDVAVNPGNSGGPLVDARGTLVGINTAIVGDTYQGVSFSIPSVVARQVYDRLRASGRVERAWLGVVLAEVGDDVPPVGDDARLRGAMIDRLASEHSPAAVAGLLKKDHVVAVDEVPIRDMGHLMRVIGSAESGSTVRIDVIRDGKRITLPVSLESRPVELDIR